MHKKNFGDGNANVVWMVFSWVSKKSCPFVYSQYTMQIG